VKQLHCIFLKTRKCECCGIHFDYEYELLVHTVQKKGAGLYCPFVDCGYSKTPFSQAHALTAHLRRHTGEQGRFACTHCGKTFPKRSQMQQHADSHIIAKDKVEIIGLVIGVYFVD
jgi:hypothetical protein